MPIAVKTVNAGGQTYGNPIVGPIDATAPVVVDVSVLTTAEVDADGNLKPGVPLTSAGILVGIAPAFVYGITIESIPVADGNTALAGVTVDPTVAVCTHGVVNRDVVEDNLGRALTADEIAGFDRAGSHLTLTTT